MMGSDLSGQESKSRDQNCMSLLQRVDGMASNSISSYISHRPPPFAEMVSLAKTRFGLHRESLALLTVNTLACLPDRDFCPGYIVYRCITLFSLFPISRRLHAVVYVYLHELVLGLSYFTKTLCSQRTTLLTKYV